MQLNTVLCVVAKYVDRELVLKIDEERYFLLHRYVIIFFLNIYIYIFDRRLRIERIGENESDRIK